MSNVPAFSTSQPITTQGVTPPYSVVGQGTSFPPPFMTPVLASTPSAHQQSTKSLVDLPLVQPVVTGNNGTVDRSRKRQRKQTGTVPRLTPLWIVNIHGGKKFQERKTVAGALSYQRCRYSSGEDR